MQTLADFVSQYPVKSYLKNETIIFQDDQPSTLFFVKSGFIKAYDIDSQGTEQFLWLASKGDFFPIVWAFSVTPTVEFFVSAFTYTEVYTVKRTDLNEFLDRNPAALQEFTRQMAVDLNHAYSQLRLLEKTRAEEKIVRSLCYLSARFGDVAHRKLREIALPITHQDIASLIGVSRETVALELKKLKDQGYIYYNKYQFVINHEKLEALL